MKYSKELKAGLVVLITLFAFWLVFQFLKGRDVFSSGNMYYVSYNNVDGLEPTKAVTINGLKVGKVEEIEAITTKTGEYSFRVKISVDDEFRFNKASKAEIYEPGFMSGKQIRILLSETPPLAENYDELEGVLNPSITDMLSQEVTPLKEKVMSVMQNLDSTLITTEAVLAQTKAGNLKLTIDNTNRALNSFRETSDQARGLVVSNTEDFKRLLENANKSFNQLNATLVGFENVSGKVNQLEVEKSLEEFQATMKNLNSFISKLNSEEGTLHKVLTDEALYDNLNTTAENLNKLLMDLEENPKKYINISVFGKNK